MNVKFTLGNRIFKSRYDELWTLSAHKDLDECQRGSGPDEAADRGPFEQELFFT